MRTRTRVTIILSLTCLSISSSGLVGAPRPRPGDVLSGRLSERLEQQGISSLSSKTFGDSQIHPISIAIDGSKTPELISDELAYRHFLQATSVTADAPPARFIRREALLKAAGLTSSERSLYISALNGLADELESISALRSAGATATELQQLKVQESQAVQNAQARLNAVLSRDALTRLDRHIQTHVKRRIVVYEQAHH